MTKFDFTYNAVENTLTVSADFAKKASNINSREYRKLRELRMENPGMIVKQRTREATTRLTYKDMEARLHRIDKNGKLVEAFKLVMEIAKTESSPYNYVYKWYKSQMEAVKAEKQNEKKTSAPNKEDLLKKLNALTSGISFNDFIDEEIELEEEEA